MSATIFIDPASNFHPYECGGSEQGCIHCEELVTDEHDPELCALCNFDDDEDTASLRARVRAAEAERDEALAAAPPAVKP